MAMNSSQNSPSRTAHLRLIDANINRVQEALRVVEDGLRFVLADRYLTEICKSLRHEFADWARNFERPDRLRMRDATGDVGRSLDFSSEYQRADLDDILTANLARACQSLRTLEEFAKIHSPHSAQTVEGIRYRVYDLEKAAGLLSGGGARWSQVGLYVLIDSCGDDQSRFRDRVAALLNAHVDVIQLRDKSLTDRQLLHYGEALVQAAKGQPVMTVLNDRVDIALAVGADAVHLGQDDLPLSRARQVAGPRLLMGVSTHNVQQVRRAVSAGADYLGVGPTFASATKSFADFPGLDFLRQVAQETRTPAFAIGGIDAANLDLVLATGIHRIAISAAVPEQIERIPETLSAIKSRLHTALATNARTPGGVDHV